MRVLLVSYDSVLGGPGRSQTVPYVRELAARGHRHALLSFELPADAADPALVASLEAALEGTPWRSVPWRRSAPRDLLAGVAALRREARAHGAELVHARGYVPALLADLARLPFLFDMRGFWPDERADGGLWRRGGTGHRLWKRIERRLCRRAAAVVVLTERARDELRRLALVPGRTAVHVIPTCADLRRFRPLPDAERAPEARGDAPRFVILGGTTTWYLLDEMLDLAARALEREPRGVLHVLTNDPPAAVVEGLERRRVPGARRLVTRVPPEAVATWISGARAAIVLLRSTWSKGASCPTKLGELLGCGVPLLMNPGVGDADTVLSGERVVATVRSFDPAGRDAALDELDRLRAEGDAAVVARCRAVAERLFDVREGAVRYDRAYRDAAEARS